MNFEERIKSTQPDGIHINCIGTAFYITEVIPEERSVSQIEANTLIDKLDILDEPELGCLTIFRKDEVIAHGGCSK
jgi:hypothetical protein